MPDRYGEEPQDLERVDREQAAAMAIVACGLCDDEGYRGTQVCTHRDYTPVARRGMERVRAAMGWEKPQNVTVTKQMTNHGQQGGPENG